MRKLAREAVIFMLVTMAVSAIGVPILIGLTEKSTSGDLVLSGAWAGAIGFFAGLGIWLFYRLVRFAIKG